MWNLRNKTNEQREKKRGRKTNQESGALTTEYKLMVTRGEVGRGMGEIGNGD